MSSSKDTVTWILEQLEPLDVRARAMFGEYGLYCDEKMVALICNNTLFVKPTEISGEFSSPAERMPPYPGAKDYCRVPREGLDDVDQLQAFIQRTADALPLPKKKSPKKKLPVITDESR
ncbi:TfoX/Sxy family protein [Rhodococcus sp. OK302]|uniref:TfoX/Sxy family protein n=1 Tax=Rhodococcus sp. OK302 TaxID=1882769 RepID=UPI000B93C0AC|nr:TfoX/Sxy family protein [Rhodococcus sp. OK302]OYD70823.1 TfoX/Sxy family transcriptional regulator of competence genes [Rhodococcus sp. OK302]